MKTLPARDSDKSSAPVLAVVWGTLLLAFYREVAGVPTVAFIGNYNLTIVEVMLVVIGISALVSPRQPFLKGLGANLIICYAAVYGIDFFRGLMTTPYFAITSMRFNAVLPAILIWSLLVPPKALWCEGVQRAWIIVGAMLGVLVVLRVVVGPTFLMVAQDLDEMDINDGGRALTAQGSMILVGAVVLLMARAIQAISLGRVSGWIELLLAGFFAIAEVLTRQGTATLSLVIAMVVVCGLTPGALRSTRIVTLVLFVIMAGVFWVLAQDQAFLDNVNKALPPGMQFDLQHRSLTFEHRQAIWEGLLLDMNSWSPLSWAIGLPAGTKPQIWLNLWGGVYWDLSIHSMYYGLLPILGVVGLCLYVALLVNVAAGTFRGVFRGSREDQVFSTVALAWVVVSAILGVSYELRNENAIPLAMALAVTLGRRQSTAAEWRQLNEQRVTRFRHEVGRVVPDGAAPGQNRRPKIVHRIGGGSSRLQPL